MHDQDQRSKDRVQSTIVQAQKVNSQQENLDLISQKKIDGKLAKVNSQSQDEPSQKSTISSTNKKDSTDKTQKSATDETTSTGKKRANKDRDQQDLDNAKSVKSMSSDEIQGKKKRQNV